MKNKSLLLILLSCSPSVFAQATGPYLGAGLGGSWINGSDCKDSAECDNQSLSVHLYGGYQFNDYLGVEATYANYGDIESLDNAGDIFNGNVNILSFEPKLSYPLSDYMSAYVKTGVSQIYYGSGDDFGFSAGAGLDIEANDQWTIRLGYNVIPNYIDSDSNLRSKDISSVMFGVQYNFWGEKPVEIIPVDESVTKEEPIIEQTPIAPENSFVEEDSRIDINNTVYFKLDSDELLPDTKNELIALASLLTANPSVKINLSGYTDIIGSKTYNWDLTQRRLDNVYQFLLEQGVIDKQLVTTNHGENWSGASDEPFWKNRKVILKTED